MKSKTIGTALVLVAALAVTMSVEVKPAEAALPGPCLINCDYNGYCRSYVKTYGALTCYINESPQTCPDCR